MMTPEEREKFKEEEKAHLRKLRALRAAANRQRAVNNLRTKMADLTASVRDTLDTHAEFVDRLDVETARNEAMIELSMEEQTSDQLSEAEERRRADALLSQMQAEICGEPDLPPAPSQEKTIGRMPDTPET